MESLLVGKAFVLLGNVMISNTITNMISNINEITTCFKSMKSTDAEKILYELETLDIFATLNVIESLMRNINYNNPTIEICINNLKEIINKILIEVDTLHTMTNYNKSLWFFQSWRSYDYNNNFKNLSTYKKVLDNRLDLFIKMVQINNITFEQLNTSKKDNIKQLCDILNTNEQNNDNIVLVSKEFI